jgi:hypothetical protein
MCSNPTPRRAVPLRLPISVPVAIPRHSHSLVGLALQSSDPNFIRIPSYSQSLKVDNLEPVSRSQNSHAFPPKITSQ